MKTIIRNSRNGTYFQGIEDWTNDSQDAFDFKGPDRAIRFVKDAGLKHMELVFAFGNPRYDVHLPIDERFALNPTAAQERHRTANGSLGRTRVVH